MPIQPSLFRARGNALPDLLLVIVGRRAINVPVASLEGRRDGVGRRPRGDVPGAEAERGDVLEGQQVGELVVGEDALLFGRLGRGEGGGEGERHERCAGESHVVRELGMGCCLLTGVCDVS